MRDNRAPIALARRKYPTSMGRLHDAHASIRPERRGLSAEVVVWSARRANEHGRVVVPRNKVHRTGDPRKGGVDASGVGDDGDGLRFARQGPDLLENATLGFDLECVGHWKRPGVLLAPRRVISAAGEGGHHDAE